jgi:hypothetical protein
VGKKVSKSLKQYQKVGRNKWTRQQLEKQKQLKKGRFTTHRATKISKDIGMDMFFMDDQPIKRRGGFRHA